MKRNLTDEQIERLIQAALNARDYINTVEDCYDGNGGYRSSRGNDAWSLLDEALKGIEK